MTVVWWHWLVLGLVLIVLEMAAAGGFYLLFFGGAALVMAVLVVADVAGPIWMQLLQFSVLSGAFLLLLRKRLLRRFQIDLQVAAGELVGETGIAAGELGPGAVGRIELRGKVLSARNITEIPIAAGERCRVVHAHGITVQVAPEGDR